MNCGRDKAMKLLAELSTGKGIGLIERKRQGQGRPTKIYVKRFTNRTRPGNSTPPRGGSFLPSGKVGFADAQKSAPPTPRGRFSRPVEVEEPDPNNIKINQTDFSQTDLSILPSVSGQRNGWIDRCDCERKIETRIGYDLLCRKYACEDVDEVVALIADTLCATRPTIRIGGDNIPADAVKERLLCLEYGHMEYAFDCLHRNTTQIRNIRAYLLTTLYNAPVTINNHYRAEVQHDFAG